VYKVETFETFIKENPHVKYIYVQWLDYMATLRTRILPIAEFASLIHSGSRIGISKGNTGTLQNDDITPAVNPVGQIYVEPDLRSLRRTHKKDPLPSATVLCFWRDESGRPIRECPRNNLEVLVNDLQYNHQTSLLCGFEIEVTFLKRNTPPKNPFSSPSTSESDSFEPYTPLTQTHAWGTLTPEQWLQLPLLANIATALEEMDIPIQQFHAESGAGQYEFVLPPLPPLHAIDTLIQARQAIMQIAALHDLRATLHPQPFPGIGTAAHAHISLDPVTPERDMQFWVGGVLKHLPAICAFSMPEAESYGRVVDDHWTGGTWVCWGTQNRETPLRRVEVGRWEVRCLDGLANMYFAVAAVVAAGMLGIRGAGMGMGMGMGYEYEQKDVTVNPSLLSEEQRAQLGITEKMPRTVEEALVKLDADGELREAMADGLVYDFMRMKKSELEMLGKMGKRERRVWLIERY
jgi:glutamine synthetase